MTRWTVVLAGLVIGGPFAAAQSAPVERPNNPVGVHLMIRDIRTDENIEKHTAWARRVCGPWGYAKLFEYQITPATKGPSDSLVKLVRKLYERQMIPVLRLGGELEGPIWQKPVHTPDGTYSDVAEACKRVVAALPRTDACPLYIEVWNEPNLGLEWSGTPDPAAFAKFYVRAAQAIRSIGDPRIRVAPGAMSPGGEYRSLDFIDACCKAEPEFVRSFDYWATHPYPGATPPEHNIHDQTTTQRFACIDLWKYELDRLAQHGVDVQNLKVLSTETGYQLGQGGGEYPIIDRARRADYHLRAFRDYWMTWPEVLGICIWDFANPHELENNSTWVHAESKTDATGWPSQPTLDFEYVAALAKPTGDYGCASGRLIDSRTRAGVPDVVVSLANSDVRFTSDRFGSFILSPITPAPGKVLFVDLKSDTHGGGRLGLSMDKPKNVIMHHEMRARTFATLRGDVINTKTGGPLADALVTVEPGHFGTRTDDVGEFQFDNLPHGYYDVVVASGGFYPHRQPAILIPAGQSTEHEYRLGPGAEARNNLISNAGFEESDADGRTALGWGSIGDDDLVSLDVQTVYAGDRAVRMDAASSGKVGVVQWTGYTTISPDRRYRLQCWLRTSGVKAATGKGARLAGTVVTNTHKTLKELASETVLHGDEPWTLLTIDFAAPPDSGRVSLRIELDAETGTCWADEAAVFALN